MTYSLTGAALNPTRHSLLQRSIRPRLFMSVPDRLSPVQDLGTNVPPSKG